MGITYECIKNVMNEVPTPCYIVSEALLEKNLKRLRSVSDQTGCKILLAQKAFSMYYYYPLVGKYLDGVTASGLYEARLGYEELCQKQVIDSGNTAKRCENHVFSPAYRKTQTDELFQICDHAVFNSFSQWTTYREAALRAGVSCGLRINPECSTQEHAIYDPCAPGSRLGVTLENFAEYAPEELKGLEGLHFHCLCEQNADALVTTMNAVEEKFGAYLYQMKWLNMGGGHHITRDDYDVETLAALLERTQKKYGLTVYLEPGEAAALNAGFLVTQVLEIVSNHGIATAIVDTSAACHMPDVLEMPYRPPLYNSGEAGEKACTYRLAGPTCLAGDLIGAYSFDRELQVGDRLVFGDMAIYSMVKNNTFNGMPLPDIIALDKNGAWQTVRQFGYEAFKGRL